MNAVILTPGRTTTTAHPVVYTTDDEFSDMLFFMFVACYFSAACGIPRANKQMSIFPECDLPWLKMGRIRFITFHIPYYVPARTSPRMSPASFIACVRVQSIKRDGL